MGAGGNIMQQCQGLCPALHTSSLQVQDALVIRQECKKKEKQILRWF